MNLCAARDPLLHHRFIRTAKSFAKKTFVVDRTLGRRVSYSRALVATIALARQFESYEGGFIGIMLPTSAGCALAILAALMSGRTPVMINYATGAEANALVGVTSSLSIVGRANANPVWSCHSRRVSWVCR